MNDLWYTHALTMQMWDDGLGDHVEHPFDYEEEIGVEAAEDLSAKAQIVCMLASSFYGSTEFTFRIGEGYAELRFLPQHTSREISGWKL
jgi:hypothetical protein